MCFSAGFEECRGDHRQFSKTQEALGRFAEVYKRKHKTTVIQLSASTKSISWDM